MRPVQRGQEIKLDTKNITGPISTGDDSASRQQLQPGQTLVDRYNIQAVIGIGDGFGLSRP
jgi:hypothetical protein